MVRHLREVEKLTLPQVKRIVERYADASGLEVPPKVQSLFRRAELSASKKAVCIIYPEGEEYTLEGTVFEITQVNFLKRFNFPDNSISRALLGEFGKEEYQEVAIRSNSEHHPGVICEFHAFITRRAVAQVGARIGSVIGVLLKVARMPNAAAAWLVEDIHVVKK
jgi:hypothetical protein